MIYLDTVGIKFLAKELNDILINSKINKIIGYDERSFSIFCGKNNLYFDSKNTPIVFIKQEKLRNTEYNSNFLLRLKKYILGGYIRTIYSHINDRIIIVIIEKMEITGKISKYRLIYELLCKQVNVLLVDEKDMILANMFYYLNSKRKNLTNSNYIFPETILKYGKYMKNLEKELQIQYETSYKPLLYSNNLFTYNEFLKLPYKEFKSLNEGLNFYFTNNNETSLLENKKKPLYKFVNKNIERLENILKKIPEDIDKNKNYEEYKIKADILLSNIYLIKQQTQVTLMNYYTNEYISIDIDNKISPSKNVENLYQKYAKCKRRQEQLQKRLVEIEGQLKYYKEQLHYIDNENDILGLEEIEKELGIQKKDKLKSTRQSKRDLYKVEYEKAIIYIGRNSIENEKITFEIANPNDLWLHIKDVPGSHVIVKCENITDDIIFYAAKLAVENSKNKISGTVDYCLKKYVKKNNKLGTGQVTYTHYKSIEIKNATHSNY